MGITIARASLLSAAARAQIGVRKLNLNNSATQLREEDGNGLGRIFDFVLNVGRRFIGFLSRVIPAVILSFQAAFGWVVEGVTALVNFNWNQTDTQIFNSMRSRNLTVAESWGQAVGSAFGWTTSIALGAGVSMLIPVIGGSTLARLIATNAGMEALEEVSAQLQNTLALTARTMLANLGASAYINFRRWLKSADRGLLRSLFGNRLGDFIKDKWGGEGTPAWTIAGQFEELIERIPNEFVERFVEGFADEAWDSFVEGGFVVAQELDEAIAQSRAGALQAMGEQRTVLVTPNRDTPEEAYPITGRRELLKGEIQATIHDYRKIYNRDVGEIVGQPATDWFRATPLRRQMVILFYAKERPPWRRPDGGRPKTATYTIPDPKPGLSWRQIKSAASVFDWGKFRATANLNNGRQMAVYGASAREAERKLRQLLELSTAEITTLSVAEEKDRNPNVRKDQTRMFPAFVTFLVRRPTVDGQGRFIGDREWDTDTKRYPLWGQTEPRDFVPLGGVGNADP